MTDEYCDFPTLIPSTWVTDDGYTSLQLIEAGLIYAIGPPGSQLYTAEDGREYNFHEDIYCTCEEKVIQNESQGGEPFVCWDGKGPQVCLESHCPPNPGEASFSTHPSIPEVQTFYYTQGQQEELEIPIACNFGNNYNNRYVTIKADTTYANLNDNILAEIEDGDLSALGEPILTLSPNADWDGTSSNPPWNEWTDDYMDFYVHYGDASLTGWSNGIVNMFTDWYYPDGLFRDEASPCTDTWIVGKYLTYGDEIMKVTGIDTNELPGSTCDDDLTYIRLWLDRALFGTGKETKTYDVAAAAGIELGVYDIPEGEIIGVGFGDVRTVKLYSTILGEDEELIYDTEQIVNYTPSLTTITDLVESGNAPGPSSLTINLSDVYPNEVSHPEYVDGDGQIYTEYFTLKFKPNYFVYENSYNIYYSCWQDYMDYDVWSGGEPDSEVVDEPGLVVLHDGSSCRIPGATSTEIMPPYAWQISDLPLDFSSYISLDVSQAESEDLMVRSCCAVAYNRALYGSMIENWILGAQYWSVTTEGLDAEYIDNGVEVGSGQIKHFMCQQLESQLGWPLLATAPYEEGYSSGPEPYSNRAFTKVIIHTDFGEHQGSGFGVPGVNIEQTLNNSYDPYSGMDLPLIFESHSDDRACSHIEVMFNDGYSVEALISPDWGYGDNNTAWGLYGSTIGLRYFSTEAGMLDSDLINNEIIQLIPDADYPEYPYEWNEGAFRTAEYFESLINETDSVNGGTIGYLEGSKWYSTSDFPDVSYSPIPWSGNQEPWGWAGFDQKVNHSKLNCSFKLFGQDVDWNQWLIDNPNTEVLEQDANYTDAAMIAAGWSYSNIGTLFSEYMGPTWGIKSIRARCSDGTSVPLGDMHQYAGSIGHAAGTHWWMGINNWNDENAAPIAENSTMGKKFGATWYNQNYYYGFPTGDDACRPGTFINPHIDNIYNTREFFDLDADGRPSLGSFSYRDDNLSNKNFLIDIPEQYGNFKQAPVNNFISNGDGGLVDKIYELRCVPTSIYSTYVFSEEEDYGEFVASTGTCFDYSLNESNDMANNMLCGMMGPYFYGIDNCGIYDGTWGWGNGETNAGHQWYNKLSELRDNRQPSYLYHVNLRGARDLTNPNGDELEKKSDFPGVDGAYRPRGGWNYLNYKGASGISFLPYDHPNHGMAQTDSGSYLPGITIGEMYQIDLQEANSSGDPIKFDEVVTGDNWGFAGYHGYTPPTFENMSKWTEGSDYDTSGQEGAGYQAWTARMPNLSWYPVNNDHWAIWIRSEECYSKNKCLFMSPGTFAMRGDYDDEWILAPPRSDGTYCIDDSGTSRPCYHDRRNRYYDKQNQYQKIYSGITSVDPPTAEEHEIQPHSSLKVSFMMMTKHWNSWNNAPEIEASIVSGLDPGSFSEGGDIIIPGALESGESVDNQQGHHYDLTVNDDWSETTFPDTDFSKNVDHSQIDTNVYYPVGIYNSTRTIGGWGGTKLADNGSAARFKNTQLNKWQKMEFTFNLTSRHLNQVGKVDDLYFIVQWGNNLPGSVYLDNFQVIEGYDFVPDVDVRKKKGSNNYGKADLTKYYDKNLQPEEYKDSTAPMEAQFYFYPRYPHKQLFDFERDIMYNDFKLGLFYLYDINWGDGSPNEFNIEPKSIGYSDAIYHTYEKSGIYEITGYMLRTKPDSILNYQSSLGVIHNERFTLRININEGLDEDFTYFGSEGFSYIPYKNTSPVISGTSYDSAYYNFIKRQLGFISDDITVPIYFERESDKLKTELALYKMDGIKDEFTVMPNFEIPRYDEDGTLIYSGIDSHPNELGKSIGNSDLTNIKYFNKPKPMAEILGFPCDESQEYNLYNLLDNSGFNNGNNHWQEHNTCGDTYSNPDPDFYAYGDDTGVEITTKNSANYTAVRRQAYPLPTKVDNKYTLTMRYKYTNSGFDNGGGLPRASVKTYNPGGTHWGNGGLTFTELPQSADWNVISIPFTAAYDDEILRSAITYGKCFCGSLGKSKRNAYYDVDETTCGGMVGTEWTTDNWGNPVCKCDTGTNGLGYCPCTPDTEINCSSGNGCYEDNYGIDYTDSDGNPSSPKLEIDWFMLQDGLDTFTEYVDWGDPLTVGECIRYDSGNPEHARYWQNIIPESYPIYRKEGIAFDATFKGAKYPVSQHAQNVLTTEWNIDTLDCTQLPKLNNGYLDAWIEVDIYLTNVEWYPRRIELTTGGENVEGFNKSIPLAGINDGLGWTEGLNKIKAYIGDDHDGGEILYWDQYQTNGWDGVPQYSDSYEFNRIQINRTFDCNNNIGTPTADYPCTGSPNDSIEIRNFKIYANPLIPKIDIESEQEWIGENEYGNTYYYPVIPRHNINGKYNISDSGDYAYPYSNILFPIEGPITDEELSDPSLKINLLTEKVPGNSNILDDISGNDNYGFTYSDYKPRFDEKTNEPIKIKLTDRILNSKKDGAF